MLLLPQPPPGVCWGQLRAGRWDVGAACFTFARGSAAVYPRARFVLQSSPIARLLRSSRTASLVVPSPSPCFLEAAQVAAGTHGWCLRRGGSHGGIRAGGPIPHAPRHCSTGCAHTPRYFLVFVRPERITPSMSQDFVRRWNTVLNSIKKKCDFNLEALFSTLSKNIYFPNL